VHHGHTWALPGGAVRGDETPAQGAAREAAEEADVDPALLHPVAQVTEEHHTWRYTTVLAVADPRVRARAASSESAELRWVDTARVEEYPLHHDFGAAWPTLLDQLGRKLVVIVDTASVPPTAEPWAAVENPWTDAPVSAAALGLTPPRPDRRHWAWWPRMVRAAGPAAVCATLDDCHTSNGDDHIVVVTEDAQLRARAGAAGVATMAVTGPTAAGAQSWAPSSGP